MGSLNTIAGLPPPAEEEVGSALGGAVDDSGTKEPGPVAAWDVAVAGFAWLVAASCVAVLGDGVDDEVELSEPTVPVVGSLNIIAGLPPAAEADVGPAVDGKFDGALKEGIEFTKRTVNSIDGGSKSAVIKGLLALCINELKISQPYDSHK